MDPVNNEVTIVDIKMPFWSIVVLLIKWAIASIPAAVILAVLWFAVLALFGGLFGGIGALFGGLSDPAI